MAYEPTIQMDNQEFFARTDRGWFDALSVHGITDWPGDGWILDYVDDVLVVVPVKVCDPVSIWGTLDTNVSPAALSIAAVTHSYEAESMQPPVEESGQPGIEPVVRVMRGYLTQQDAVDALQAELEV